MTEQDDSLNSNGPGEPKVLVCALNEEGRVIASMRVDPLEEKVEAARDVMAVVSPLVKEKIVLKGVR